jgi:hypothetical protein
MANRDDGRCYLRVLAAVRWNDLLHAVIISQITVFIDLFILQARRLTPVIADPPRERV